MANQMTIGSLAKAAGVHVETIRYYQRLGLIHEPQKPPRGQRQYSESTLAEVEFVRRAQQLGFSLAEIRDLQRHSSASTNAEVRRIAEQRYSRLTIEARQLTRTRTKLKYLLAKSRRYKGEGVDPIITALQGKKAVS